MSHVRQQCMARITALVSGLPLAGTRVYQERLYPFGAAELPGRLVRYLSDTEIADSRRSLGAPRIFTRTAMIEVVNVVQATTGIDAELDDLCVEVEKALAMPVSGPWTSITLKQTSIDFSADGDQPCGEARMAYEVQYAISENAPDVAL